MRWPLELTSAGGLAVAVTTAGAILLGAPPPTGRAFPVGGLVEDVRVITADFGGRLLGSVPRGDTPGARPPLLTPEAFVPSLRLSGTLTDPHDVL